jgi:glycosyltransferase involved in cell wall biosynthesis
MASTLSIIIPCYNEAENLPTIIAQANTLVQQNHFATIVLVNNGSTDNTKSILTAFEKQNTNSQISIYHVEKNLGYGYGIIAGLAVAKTDLLCWTHADQQTDINDTIKAYHFYIANNYTVVKGNRINRNKLDAFFTWGMQLYTNYKLKTNLHDINAQPKLFSRSFWEAIQSQAPNDFSLDMYLLYKAKTIGTIGTIDVQYLKRKFGEAKGGGSLKGKWKLINRTLKYINELANNI